MNHFDYFSSTFHFFSELSRSIVHVYFSTNFSFYSSEIDGDSGKSVFTSRELKNDWQTVRLMKNFLQQKKILSRRAFWEKIQSFFNISSLIFPFVLACEQMEKRKTPQILRRCMWRSFVDFSAKIFFTLNLIICLFFMFFSSFYSAESCSWMK